MHTTFNPIGWHIIKIFLLVYPLISLRIWKLRLIFRHPTTCSFCHILLKIGVHHLLLNRLWFCLNIFANWYVSFSCFLIEVTQAMRALNVRVKWASNYDGLRIFFRLCRERNVVILTPNFVVFDIFRSINFFVSLLRYRLNKWVCASGLCRIPILRLLGGFYSWFLVLKNHTLLLILYRIVSYVTLINLRILTQVLLAARILQRYVTRLERMHLYHLLLMLF